MQHVAYIALGSNIEPRAETLVKALTMLDALDGISVAQVSRFIETEPVGSIAQGKFLNGAAALRTEMGPEELMRTLLDIEARLGRDRSKEQHWGPRTCDLDLLLYDDLVMNDPAVTIPHPRMQERLFVLKPLCEIAPKLEHPVLHKTVTLLLAELEGS